MIIFSVVINTLRSLMRRCPACHRQQVVPRDKARMPVACKFCGARVPPKKD